MHVGTHVRTTLPYSVRCKNGTIVFPDWSAERWRRGELYILWKEKIVSQYLFYVLMTYAVPVLYSSVHSTLSRLMWAHWPLGSWVGLAEQASKGISLSGSFLQCFLLSPPALHSSQGTISLLRRFDVDVLDVSSSPFFPEMELAAKYPFFHAHSRKKYPRLLNLAFSRLPKFYFRLFPCASTCRRLIGKMCAVSYSYNVT